MRKLSKLALFAGIFGASLLGFNQADAQKRVRVVDAILYNIDSLKSGIPNLKFSHNGKELITNSEGYVDLITAVEDENNIENLSELKVRKNEGKLNFDYGKEFNLKIYDILGREIKSFDDSRSVSWGLDNNFNQRISNGTYVYMLKSKDEIKSGMLVKVDNEIYLQNYSKIENKKDNVNSLKKISEDGLESLIINDDSKDYFNVNMNVSADKIPEVIYMIPNLSFDSPDYRNILHFVKWMTYTDGSTKDDRLGRFVSIPIKLFHNRSKAPNQNYINAVDSAVSPSSKNSWESMTSFDYKGNLLPKMNLFKEVYSDPDTGEIMDYSKDKSFWYLDKWNSITPIHARVHVNKLYDDNNDWGIISRETKHELGHGLIGIRHSTDEKHNMQSGQYISKDEGKAIRIIYSLPNLTDMGIYKEE